VLFNRRHFCSSIAAISASAWLSPDGVKLLAEQAAETSSRIAAGTRETEFLADVVVLGGGLGGCSAALALLRDGLRVVMTEETDWIGGQLTSQAVRLTSIARSKRTGQTHLIANCEQRFAIIIETTIR
jgi:heterodisulfide reductase subunit A-like polyferredoxin